MKKNIALIYGGNSTEHDISLMSAASVYKKLDTSQYNIVPVLIEKSGAWYLMDSINPTDGNTMSESKKVCEVIFSCNPSKKGLFAFRDNKTEFIKIDVAFPVLHGKNGEDGTIQGLFEMCEIPYVGCGVLASSVCMDKGIAHAVFADAGIDQAKWEIVFARQLDNFNEIEKRLEIRLGYPMFVKPANSGSSVGINKANNKDELFFALKYAAQFDVKIVVEETIRGKEVECAVLGNLSPIASAPGEIAPCNEFYDFDSKYESESKLFIPARISEETTEKLRKTAVAAYLAAGCRGLSRVDFFVTETGRIILNEINTLPGFTSISMYPKLFEYSGTEYSELLGKLIALACGEDI